MSKMQLVSIYPVGAYPLSKSSGNVGAATAAATLTPDADKQAFCAGFTITGSGATAALPVSVTLSGVQGGTMTFTYAAAAGVLVANTPLHVTFNPPLAATAINTVITVSCPTLGSGNTNNTANIWGYQLSPAP